jgi:hypothetical protein
LGTTNFLVFVSWLQKGRDKGEKGPKDSRFELLLLPNFDSVQIHHLFPSLEKERIQLDLDGNVMFTALVDFAEEPAGFKILDTTQSIGLHVSSLMLDLQLIFSMKANFTLMGIHSHFTLVLYVKNMLCLFCIKKGQRRESIEL